MGKRGLLVGLLMLALVSAPSVAFAQAVADSEVAKGIHQVNDGDYDGAIVTLDAAVRRLATDPSKIKDLAQGYLYLGIAYVGKGHEAAAKAKFREAVRQTQELSLSPEQYPPKVINLFEAAKEELRKASPAEPSQAAASSARQPTKKSGSTKYVLIGGGIAAAGVGIGLALGGGGDDSQGVIETPPHIETFMTEERDGLLTPDDSHHHYMFGPGGPGPWGAEVTWVDGERGVAIAAYRNSVLVAEGRRAAPNVSLVEWDGLAGAFYEVHVWTDDEVSGNGFEYHLMVTFPRP